MHNSTWCTSVSNFNVKQPCVSQLHPVSTCLCNDCLSCAVCDIYASADERNCVHKQSVLSLLTYLSINLSSPLPPGTASQTHQLNSTLPYSVDKNSYCSILMSKCIWSYNYRLITTVQQHENLQLILASQVDQLWQHVVIRVSKPLWLNIRSTGALSRGGRRTEDFF